MIRKANLSFSQRKLFLVHPIIKIQFYFQIQLHLDQLGPDGPAHAYLFWEVNEGESLDHSENRVQHSHYKSPNTSTQAATLSFILVPFLLGSILFFALFCVLGMLLPQQCDQKLKIIIHWFLLPSILRYAYFLFFFILIFTFKIIELSALIYETQCTYKLYVRVRRQETHLESESRVSAFVHT